MAVKVALSVVARRPTELNRRFTQAQKLATIVHLDIMDGHFVSTRSAGQSAVRRLRSKRQLEVHLMVKNPMQWSPTILHLNPDRVILHVELRSSLLSVINFFRSHHIRIALAINPGTSLERLRPWRRYVQDIVVMGVHPGRYHARFIASTMKRVTLLHRRYPRLRLTFDGGMNPDTIPAVIRAGAKHLVVGSYVMLNPRPADAWKEIQRLVLRSK